MKKLLVITYSQSGHLTRALEATLAPLRGQAEITVASVEPVQPYPFPWRYREFVAAFP